MNGWLLWVADPRGESLRGIYTTEELAEAAAEEEARKVRDYHGPHYPAHLDQRLGERKITTQYGDRIRWEQAPLQGEERP
jgi:hypothetical protein